MRAEGTPRVATLVLHLSPDAQPDGGHNRQREVHRRVPHAGHHQYPPPASPLRCGGALGVVGCVCWVGVGVCMRVFVSACVCLRELEVETDVTSPQLIDQK